MKGPEVFDFQRIFLGEHPSVFLLEIIFRTVVMYIYTILLLRFLGKRSMGQLSTLELAIIICFGSAVGDPMMGIEVPVLHGIMVITTVAFLQTAAERLINRNKKLEVFMEGSPDCLVKNGVMLIHSLYKNNLSQEDLFRQLRNKGIEQLGEVRKALFETSGVISVWCLQPEDQLPGLGILPEESAKSAFKCSGEGHILSPGYYSCRHCGFTRFYPQDHETCKCPYCKEKKWEPSKLPKNQ